MKGQTKMKNSDKKALIEWLDSRWGIVQMFNRLEDELFYRGAFEAIEHMGYWVIREENGHHIMGKK